MSENENESSHNSENSVEDQLAEITEFEHKIRLLRWGMVVGTLLIIALGVINIINKVNRTLEPAKQIVADAKVVDAGACCRRGLLHDTEERGWLIGVGDGADPERLGRLVDQV